MGALHEPTHRRPLPGGEQAFLRVLSVPLLGGVRGGFMGRMHAQERKGALHKLPDVSRQVCVSVENSAMTVLPVMERELRAEARHAFSYWLRTLGALVSLILFAVMMIDAQDNTPGLGAKLFGNLNTALFITIWLLVPLLTADCLSRERREGTLGILFLTPLTARAIIIGKGLIHSLRALTMVMAALPVLAIPFLLGGVTWREGLMALLLNLSSIGLGVAVGLVASAYCRQWNRALFLAEVLAAVVLVGFGILFSLVLVVQVAIPYVPGWHEQSLREFNVVLCTGFQRMWSEAIKFLPIAATRPWLAVVAEIAGVCLL